MLSRYLALNCHRRLVRSLVAGSLPLNGKARDVLIWQHHKALHVQQNKWAECYLKDFIAYARK